MHLDKNEALKDIEDSFDDDNLMFKTHEKNRKKLRYQLVGDSQIKQWEDAHNGAL